MKILALALAAVSSSLASASARAGDTRPQEVVRMLTGFPDRQAAASRTATRDYLARLLTDAGLAPERHAYRSSGENVFGLLPPTEGEGEVVVLGAHFDSVRGSPGANDNATGIAVVDAVTRAMSLEPCRTRGLLVVYFDEEELGLVGSRYFAAKLKNAGTAVHSVHTIDQMGWDRDTDRAIELELPTADLTRLYERHAQPLRIPLHTTRTSSTNHSSFRSQGFAAVGLTEEYVNGDTTPHYHRSTDTFATVDFAYLESTARLMTDAVSELVTEGCVVRR